MIICQIWFGDGKMQRLKILVLVFLCVLWGCSNLSDPRFSKDYYNERMLQLTRKSNLIANDKTKLVIFSTFLSRLDSQKYEDGEYFFVEVDFVDEKIKFKDLSFSLLGESPKKVEKIKNLKQYNVSTHAPWNECYLVVFESVYPTEISKLALEIKVRGYEKRLLFDYGFRVENIL